MVLERRIIVMRKLRENGSGRLLTGQLKNKLQIVLRQKNGKDTTFFLKNYDYGDDFMETAIDILKEAKFSSYDSEAVGMHYDDD